jgi:hypothetical protein
MLTATKLYDFDRQTHLHLVPETRFLINKVYQDRYFSSSNTKINLPDRFNGEYFNTALKELQEIYAKLEVRPDIVKASAADAIDTYHDVLIVLQLLYMSGSVALAIRMNELNNTMTSSMVDDIFYIFQNCSGRAAACGAH